MEASPIPLLIISLLIRQELHAELALLEQAKVTREAEEAAVQARRVHSTHGDP